MGDGVVRSDALLWGVLRDREPMLASRAVESPHISRPRLRRPPSEPSTHHLRPACRGQSSSYRPIYPLEDGEKAELRMYIWNKSNLERLAAARYRGASTILAGAVIALPT